MKTSLLKGLDEDEAKVVKEQYVGSYLYRRQLIKRVEEQIAVLQEKMLNEEIDSEGGWSLRQASYLAEIKALRKIISLF